MKRLLITLLFLALLVCPSFAADYDQSNTRTGAQVDNAVEAGLSGGAATGILKSDGSYALSAATDGTDYISSLAADATPQLGGFLDLNNKLVVDAANAFGAADTDPDVTGGVIFKTGAADVYTDFDDGTDHTNLKDGQLMIILFQHAAGLDCTSSQINCNSGNDWTASDGDSAICTFDDTTDADGQWLCIISASAPATWAELPALTATYVIVGNAGNAAAAVEMTGDVTISNAGVTAIAADTIGADEIADTDFDHFTTSGGAATVVEFALDAASDAGDVDITSVDKLEGVDNAVYIDLGADTLAEIVADGRVDITTAETRLEVDADAYLSIATADGGATTISQTSDGTDQIIIGDGTDRVDIASDTWDVTNGVISASAGANITMADGQFIDLTGIVYADTSNEGIAIPTYVAGKNPADNKPYMAYDASNNAIMVYEAGGWTDTSSGTGAATTLNYITTAAEGSLSAESVLTAGYGVDITDAGGDGGAVTVAVDTTEISADGSDTWSDNSNAAIEWTFDVSGTDHTMTAGNGVMTFGDAVTVTDTLTATNGIALGTSKSITGTTGLTIGAGTETVAINSSDWDIDATGVATGFGNFTSNGTVEGATLTEGGEAVYNATETPGGELGGTWASPTIDDSVTVATWTFTGTTTVADIDGSGTISANLFTPDSADGADIGSATLEFSDVYLADGSIIKFGDDQDVTLTHVADTGLDLNLSLGITDDVFLTFGGNLSGRDWTVGYDETTSDALEFTHTAGAGADVTFDLNDNAAASTFTISNSDGTYAANLAVDGTISQGGSTLAATYQPLNDYLTDIAAITSNQGDVIYFNGTDWVDLAPGTAGYYLQTGGAAANPVWAAGSGTGVAGAFLTSGAVWNGDTASPQKNDLHDYFVVADADYDGLPETLDSTVTIGSGGDPADSATGINLVNNVGIWWEADATGTDIQGILVDASEVVQIGASGASGVTITPATTITGALTLTASGSVGTTLNPDTDGGASLGTVNTLEWQNLFLNTGAVLNWENSDVTLTHSANTLTLTGGDFVVDTLNGHTFTAGSSTFTGTAAAVYTFPGVTADIAPLASPSFTTPAIGAATGTSLDISGAAGLVLQNDESITNAVDGAILLSRNDSGTVTVTAADDDANAALTVVAGGTGKLTLGNATNADISIVSDGVDLSETELAILDGVTSTTAQINYLDAADGETGSGSVVFDDTPTLITPVLGAATATSLIATGIIDGLTNVTITTDGSESANPANKMSHVIINKHNTEATAFAVTLPATAIAGMQLLIKNGMSADHAAATTGVITITVPATHYAWNPTTNTECAQGYDLVSGGAAGDFIGMVATSATEWDAFGSQGTWTCTVSP